MHTRQDGEHVSCRNKTASVLLMEHVVVINIDNIKLTLSVIV